MTGQQVAKRGALVAALCAGAFAASVAPAAADQPAFVSIGVVHTLGDSCYGQGQAGISAPTGAPGTTRFGISFVKYTPTFGQPCTIKALANWRNLDTGATGTVTVPVTDSSSSNQAPPTVFADLPTGPGRVQVSMTTDRLHLPVPTVEIRIP
ncbi:hypothetical protein AB0B25_02465 [Nocardia sp. NPDC049190]|uniref:hypothetical protein n=1 Tax=Nocardia sp. NPDC049190 TaxID=3155650 RepID=UPI0033DF0870